MNLAKWPQIMEIYDRALEMRKEDRAAYCDRACGSDREMRHELQKLLNGHAQAEEKKFLDQAAWRIKAVTIKEDAMIGKVLGGIYKIKEEISTGGFGEVYLAVGNVGGREAGKFVVKVAKYKDEDQRRRFDEEVRILADLKHENIAPIYNWGEIDGFPYFVMEYLDGIDLGGFIARNKQCNKGLDLMLVNDITRQACSGLQYAHDNGVDAHRDIKPKNIMILQSGDKYTVKVIDFGLAKSADAITRKATSGIIGSFNYISPEQIAPEQYGMPDRRCDIYAMGLVIYEMLTGKMAVNIDTKDNEALLVKQLIYTPHPPGINPQVDQVVMKALKKNPDERQQTIKALADELDTAIKGIQEHVRPVKPPSGPTPNPIRRVFLAAASLLALIVAGTLAWQNWPPITENGTKNPLPSPSISVSLPAIESPKLNLYLKGAANGPGEIVTDKVFTSRDELRFTVTPPADGYIYLVQRGSLGDLTLIYPDSRMNIKDNSVKGGMPVFFPPVDAKSRPRWFGFDGVPGVETVYGVFVSDKSGQIASAIEEGIRQNRRSPSPLNQLLLEEGIEVMLQKEMEKPNSSSISVSKLVFNHK